MMTFRESRKLLFWTRSCSPWLLFGPALLILSTAVFAQNAAQRSALARLEPQSTGSSITQASPTQADSRFLSRPAGVAFDPAGNLYIVDTGANQILEVSTLGVLTIAAGSGEQGYSGDHGPAVSASLDSPEGVVVDAAGNLFIADTHNHCIRVVTSGTILTIAGTGAPGFSGDGGAAIAATFNLPRAVAIDAGGNLFIADTNNHRIRKLSGSTITTVAGNGEQLYLTDGVLATQTGLDSPSGIVLDAQGNLFIGDTHNQRVRKVTAASGLISTFAGNGTRSFAGDAGAATSAALAMPRGLALAADGTVYFADSENNRIRNVNASGIIATTAGNGEQGFFGDTSSAAQSVLDTPYAVASGPAGLLAIADTNSFRIREVSNSDIVTVTGLGNSGAEALVLSGAPPGPAPNGNLSANLINAASTASGSVTFLDVTAAVTTVGGAPLSDKTATISLPALTTGTHRFVASYSGDALNPAVSSGVFVVMVSPPAATNNFSLTAITTLQNVQPGSKATYQLSLTPQSGAFGGSVALTVSGLPSGYTASFTPASIAAGTTGAVPSALTIQTVQQSSSLSRSPHPLLLPATLCLLLFPLLASRRTRNTLLALTNARPALVLLLLLGTCVFSGCGSSHSSTQPLKTYTLTIVAASPAVGTSPSVTQSTSVTLIVQ